MRPETLQKEKQEQIEISLFNQLLEAAKKDRKGLIALKNSAVKLRNFELAAKLRQIEIDCFPETKQIKEQKNKARQLNLLFRMINLDVPTEACWLINEAIKLHEKKKGKFTLEDGISLMLKRDSIFVTE